MGFLRKATWVATGGASGLVVKANSKKERTAKAMEKQVKLQKEQLRLEKQLAQGAAAASAATSPSRPMTRPERVESAEEDRLQALSETPEGRLLADDIALAEKELKKAKSTLARVSTGYLDANGRMLTPRGRRAVKTDPAKKAKHEGDVSRAQQRVAAAQLNVDELKARQSGLLALEPPPEPDEVAGPTSSLTDELERLAALHRDGVLSDDEFQAAKTRIISPD